MEWVSVPMHTKNSIVRTSIRHPTRVASDLIREELRSMNLLASSSPSTKAVAEFLASDHELGDKYASHPVTQEALNEGFSHEQIQPISVYFDGVQYTKNENFLGFYVANLRTRQQRLVWLLRGLLANQVIVS